MKKINDKDLDWIPASHEDPKDPGVLKKVLVKHEEAFAGSSLMMLNLAEIPVGKTHVAHLHETMEEIFYFLEGEGEIEIDGEKAAIIAGDRVIVPPKQVHQISNTGKIKLKFIGIGIALG